MARSRYSPRVRRALLSLAIPAVVAVGCSNSDVVSCTIAAPDMAGVFATVCEEYAGLSRQDQDLWSRTCFVAPADGGAPPSARFEYAPCTHANALGGCRLKNAPITFWYYADGPYTEADIPALCAQIDATQLAP
jgi:hypothetical protein